LGKRTQLPHEGKKKGLCRRNRKDAKRVKKRRGQKKRQFEGKRNELNVAKTSMDKGPSHGQKMKRKHRERVDRIEDASWEENGRGNATGETKLKREVEFGGTQGRREAFLSCK